MIIDMIVAIEDGLVEKVELAARKVTPAVSSAYYDRGGNQTVEIGDSAVLTFDTDSIHDGLYLPFMAQFTRSVGRITLIYQNPLYAELVPEGNGFVSIVGSGLDGEPAEFVDLPQHVLCMDNAILGGIAASLDL